MVISFVLSTIIVLEPKYLNPVSPRLNSDNPSGEELSLGDTGFKYLGSNTIIVLRTKEMTITAFRMSYLANKVNRHCSFSADADLDTLTLVCDYADDAEPNLTFFSKPAATSILLAPREQSLQNRCRSKVLTQAAVQ
jgi:hypothetical protein